MFVCNIKMNSGWMKKIAITIVVLALIIVFMVVGYKFYDSTSRVMVRDEVDTSQLEINSSNYTDILKDSHENIDKYVGKKVTFTGFVYRLYDFGENQFVLAREMIISSDNHAVVVGFLSECDNASSFKDGAWVEAEGVIAKGNYHGDIPVIKVKSMKEVCVPKDEFVYPPDDSYVRREFRGHLNLSTLFQINSLQIPYQFSPRIYSSKLLRLLVPQTCL